MNNNQSQSSLTDPKNIVEPPFFSNWADLFFPKIANRLLPIAARIPGLSPNTITLTSFFLYVLGSILLFVTVPHHLLLSAALLPLSYILDCLDGQFARTQKMSSRIGDYLDKTLDVLKIFIITASLSYAVYLNTQNITSVYLGFISCFFFTFRYYVKLETVLGAVARDNEYLAKSRVVRYDLYESLTKKYNQLSQTIWGKLQLLWYWNRSLFFVDEAEFVVFTTLGALLNRLDITLLVLAVSQAVIAFWRLFERGFQIQTSSPKLLEPMRK